MKRSAKKSSAGNASCVATLYHLKRFRGTKHIKLNTWFRLKRFRRTKCGAHQILAVYDARFGKGESDEISHDAPSFMTFAERTRFELVVQVAPYVGLANRWFQPLTHLSGNAFLREIR